MQALLLTPFDASYQPVRRTISAALREANIEPVEISSYLDPGDDITLTIDRIMRSSSLIVADISRQNPNVYFELGFAHAQRIPTLIIADTNEEGSLPSSLASFQILSYDTGNLRSLRQQVSRFATFQRSRRG